ncbi:SET and MYND domain-containing protein 4-like [Aphidius gifuensis]|uniref:SET and MYND domain-containing protein 4-like n=1 Tax=Aphidius gifuensis TaxID=684658 RepID=UPI001CDC5541|nr:SET and MYND domain-containing protein 4-like [Aphidius gifuensis]
MDELELKTKEKSNLEIQNPPIQSKNNDVAEIYLNQGMIYEQDNKFEISKDLYSKGIAYAEPGSSMLGELYFKRSKIYYSHQLLRDCLVDSERALNNLLPDNEFKNDLNIQMAGCHQGLAKWYLKCSSTHLGHLTTEEYQILSDKLHVNNDFIDDSVNMYKWVSRPLPPVVAAVHDIFPEFTDALKVEFTKELGTHVIATRNIEPGEILCVRKAYAITVNRGLRYNLCSYCKIQTWSSVPCEKCVQAVYCSVTCREYAYNEYHDMECKIIPKLLSYGIQDKFLVALRITIIAMKEINNSVDAMRYKISTYDKFVTPSPIFEKLVIDALTKLSYDSIYITASKYSPHLMTHESQSVASCVIMAYFYGVEIKIFKNKDKMNLIANFNGLNMSMPLINRRSIKVSNAINGYSNLFHHSCRKMIAHSLHHNSISIRSICSIKKGEQVFDNYGISFDDYDKETRQELLKNLNYICKCKVCVDDVKLVPIKKGTIPEENLKCKRSEIETLKELMKNLELYTGRQYIVNDHLPWPHYVPEYKTMSEFIIELEKYLSYNTKELNECIKLYHEVIAVEQVPYVTLQDVSEIDKKL